MNVRSAMTAMLALATSLLVPATAPAADPATPRVTIAVLPAGTTVEDLGNAMPDASLGLLSPGLGTVPAGQTYLDITQGNRLSQSLYPDQLPPLYVTGAEVPPSLWRQVEERADDAPAELVPGLLARRLGAADVPVAAEPDTGSAALIAVGE